MSELSWRCRRGTRRGRARGHHYGHAAALALVIALAGVCPCLCSTFLMIRPHAMNGDAVFSLIVGGTCIPSRNFMGGACTWQLRACRRAGAHIFGEG